MEKNTVLSAILNRRSIRRYTGGPVAEEQLLAILEAARWAPSGLNNQPWRFAVVRDPAIRIQLAALTKYGRVLKACDVCIAVFYNTESGYNRDKDLMGIGASIQNMLLAADSLGLGAVWLGEILNRKEEVHSALGIAEGNELMAVVAIGHPDEIPTSKRKPLDQLLIKNI